MIDKFEETIVTCLTNMIDALDLHQDILEKNEKVLKKLKRVGKRNTVISVAALTYAVLTMRAVFIQSERIHSLANEVVELKKKSKEPEGK